jgi:TonB-linked SusC/RagA family outer membrane protein
MKKSFYKLIKPGPVLIAGSVLFGLGFSHSGVYATGISIERRTAIGTKLQAAAVQVQGVVKDESGQPIPGVSVKVKGTSTVVATDGSGRFTITVPATTSVLVFSFIGYDPQEITVGTQTNINVSLKPNSTNLQTVEVVAVGYGTLKQKEITSAVSHVSNDEFRQGGSRNPLDLIQGKVPGLTLTRTGGSNPNGGVSVQLRGAVSVTGSSSPLYVIDGIPEANPDLLQQDDIESIDVLKDGSAAAIYGTRANAGVIIITTKKGKAGPPQFNYSSYFRKEYAKDKPNFLTADEFRQKIASGELNQEDFGSSSDFYDALIKHDNFSQNHNLALSGGTDNSNYRASINYRDLQGITLENGRKEYTVRLNINQKGLNDRLNAQFNLASNFNNANMLGGGGWESEAAKNPTLSNFNPDGSYRYDLTSTNEYARLFMETNKRKQQTTSADAKLDLDIIEGLKASVFGSVTRNSNNDGSFRSKASEDSMENSDFPGGGYASKGTDLNQKFAVEPTLQFNKIIQEKHSINAVAGYSYRYEINEGSFADNRGFINDNFHEDNLGQGSALGVGKASISSYKNDNTLVAFFGRVNYALNNRYMAQFILRREGASRFGNNNKWGNFPAVSAGWNISEEDFLKDSKVISYLKFRAGYGVTGNSGFENNASRVTLGGGGKYLFPDGNYYETYGPDRNPNPNLQWETKREFNVGLDFRLLNNKLGGSIDAFKRTTKGLLDYYTSPQPPYIRDRIYANVGTLSSKGIEVALNYAAIEKKDFSWNMDFTASTLKNTLDSYSNEQFNVPYVRFGDIGGAGALDRAFITYEGGRIGEFWGKKFAGFTEDGKWLFYNRSGEAVRNDQINNSPNKDETDLQNLGNAVPKYYASWTNNFRYKQFDLRIFMRGKFDYKILNTTALAYGNKTWSGNVLRETFTKYSQINDTYMYSDYYLEEGSFLKLDEVTFGYNLKLNSKWARSARIYASAQNLATITGYSGIDPDFVQDTGLGNGDEGHRLGIQNRNAYPSTRSFLIGLNIGF